VIQRSELRQVLKQGAQAFIQRVQVRPAFRAGRFFGWRVIAYRGPGPVRPGDIVRRINGKGLERPEQFMRAWEGLGRSSQLVLEMVRRGRRLVLRWSIVD
jgi:type II secretory pathway component PulC